jgi:hypothetical protein
MNKVLIIGIEGAVSKVTASLESPTVPASASPAVESFTQPLMAQLAFGNTFSQSVRIGSSSAVRPHGHPGIPILFVTPPSQTSTRLNGQQRPQKPASSSA